MSRTLNFSFVRRLTTYLRLKKCSINHIKPHFSNARKLFITSQICSAVLTNESRDKIDTVDGLQKACEEGDAALIKLMDQLKEFVIVVSKEYRMCLIKQIEITEAASSMGPLSEVWDELPEYRTLAAELNQELNEYMALFNTIGQMAYNESLVQFVTGNNEDLINVIGVKYRELELLLQKEFDENKKIEKELLATKCDSILNSVNGGDK